LPRRPRDGHALGIYRFTPSADGTELTEFWEFPAAGVAVFEEMFGDEAEAEIAKVNADTRPDIAATLAAIKRAAEAG
jgi:hypothetical protein